MRRVKAKWLKEPSLQAVFAIIEAAGGEARVAGGAVRNAVMKLPVDDIDIATTLLPRKVMRAFRAAGHSVYPTGIEHGTVTVSIGHHGFQVTTLRRDIFGDGRRAVVAFTDDWQVDAERRDFTMNALYCDATGEIYDYTDGCEDILKDRIRFVGTPEVRIKEDYLRILRYFRFISVYEKLKPDEHGLSACSKFKKGLLDLSAERIAQEMFKLLEGRNAVPVLKLMARNKVLNTVLAHTTDFRAISRLPRDAVLRAFVLAKQPLALPKAWRLSNEQARRIEDIATYGFPAPSLRENEQKRILYMIGKQAWIDIVQVAFAKSRAGAGDRAWKRMLSLPARWPVPKFPVSGRDLMEMGYSPGPKMGVLLKQLEEYWVASDFKPTRVDLMEQMKGIWHG